MPANPTTPAQAEAQAIQTGHSDMMTTSDEDARQLSTEWRAWVTTSIEKTNLSIQGVANTTQESLRLIAGLTNRVEAIEDKPREVREWLNTSTNVGAIFSGCLTTTIAIVASFVTSIIVVVLGAILPHLFGK